MDADARSPPAELGRCRGVSATGVGGGVLQRRRESQVAGHHSSSCELPRSRRGGEDGGSRSSGEGSSGAVGAVMPWRSMAVMISGCRFCQ